MPRNQHVGKNGYCRGLSTLILQEDICFVDVGLSTIDIRIYMLLQVYVKKITIDVTMKNI